MKIAVYARVSTDDQSVDMQLRDLREYAKQRGFEISHEYIDRGISGSVRNRPGLDELMRDARKRKFSGVMVWRFDRLARSTKHLIDTLHEFKNLGIAFFSFNEAIDTSSPLGEAIFTIIGAMAQLERDIIRERVRGGLRAAKARGKKLGRPTKRNDVAILQLRSEGFSIRKIAEKLGTTPRVVQLAVEKATRLGV